MEVGGTTTYFKERSRIGGGSFKGAEKKSGGPRTRLSELDCIREMSTYCEAAQ